MPCLLVTRVAASELLGILETGMCFHHLTGSMCNVGGYKTKARTQAGSCPSCRPTRPRQEGSGGGLWCTEPRRGLCAPALQSSWTLGCSVGALWVLLARQHSTGRTGHFLGCRGIPNWYLCSQRALQCRWEPKQSACVCFRNPGGPKEAVSFPDLSWLGSVLFRCCLVQTEGEPWVCCVTGLPLQHWVLSEWVPQPSSGCVSPCACFSPCSQRGRGVGEGTQLPVQGAVQLLCTWEHAA